MYLISPHIKNLIANIEFVSIQCHGLNNFLLQLEVRENESVE